MNEYFEKILEDVSETREINSYQIPVTEDCTENDEDIISSTKLNKEFLDRYPRKWIIPGLLQTKQIGIIGGCGGHGKSLFCLALCEYIADNKVPWEQNIKSQDDIVDGNILFITTEESEREIAHRRCSLSYTSSSEYFIWSTIDKPTEKLLFYNGSTYTLNETIYSKISKYIKKYNIKLIIIDNISSFVGLIDENNNVEVNNALDAIKSLLQKRDMGILLVHHTKKGIRGDLPQDRFRGAGSFINIVRVALLLERNKNKDGTSYSNLIVAKTNSLNKSQIEAIERCTLRFEQNNERVSITIDKETEINKSKNNTIIDDSTQKKGF